MASPAADWPGAVLRLSSGGEFNEWSSADGHGEGEGVGDLVS
jgi:hypothetical protein